MKAKRVLAGLALATLAAGCGAAPGSNSTAAKQKQNAAKATPTATSKPDISKDGNVTLTVWDQEVRGGQNKEMKQLNAEFMQKYPNVTIKRVAKSFDDLNK